MRLYCNSEKTRLEYLNKVKLTSHAMSEFEMAAEGSDSMTCVRDAAEVQRGTSTRRTDCDILCAQTRLALSTVT